MKHPYTFVSASSLSSLWGFSRDVEELHVSHKQSNGVTLLGVVHVWEMDYGNSMNTEATQRQANSVVSVLTCNWKVNYHSQVLHKDEELQERTENKDVRVKRTGNDCSGQFQFYLILSFTTWQQSVSHDCCLPPWHYPLSNIVWVCGDWLTFGANLMWPLWELQLHNLAGGNWNMFVCMKR